MRHLLRSLLACSAIALSLAAHADTFAGSASFADTSGPFNLTNFTGTFSQPSFHFSGPVGTTYTDVLTITSSNIATLSLGASTDAISVSVHFTSPNAANGDFSGTATDLETVGLFTGFHNFDDIDWSHNSQTINFADGSAVLLTLPDFSFSGGADPLSGKENLTITVTKSPVPEPSTFVLLGSGLIGAAGALRRRLSF